MYIAKINLVFISHSFLIAEYKKTKFSYQNHKNGFYQSFHTPHCCLQLYSKHFNLIFGKSRLKIPAEKTIIGRTSKTAGYATYAARTTCQLSRLLKQKNIFNYSKIILK